ncbi:hypothetical protein PG996_014293 [Apiospora saccharicola]|uniref:Uncharacterized protein n=1 Tax=Apiospora saccharicola TaxID=335842 RepID=A0ABR1THX5_9PEZI
MAFTCICQFFTSLLMQPEEGILPWAPIVLASAIVLWPMIPILALAYRLEQERDRVCTLEHHLGIVAISTLGLSKDSKDIREILETDKLERTVGPQDMEVTPQSG